ncbi:hypothetical protein [Curtobacterium sp. L1-20]|uniref:hypothetical protein n=1 Tax=Curtobacterium sp. L1-20 TaxID=3138181 RepID=UPI003B526111
MVSVWQSSQPYIQVSWRAEEHPLEDSPQRIRESVGTVARLGGVFAGEWSVAVWGSPDADAVRVDDLDDAALLRLIERGVDRNHDGSVFEPGGYSASLATTPSDGTGAVIELHIGAASDQPNSGSLTVSIMQSDRAANLDVSESLGKDGRQALESLVRLWGASSGRLGIAKADRAQRKLLFRLGLTTFLRDRTVPFTQVPMPASVEISNVEDGVWIDVRPGSEEVDAVVAAVVEASAVINDPALRFRYVIELGDIGYENFPDAIPLLGGFLENLYQYWWDDYSSIADYVDFYVDGFTAEELAAMRQEFVSLGADRADDGDVETFLRRMNVNYRISSGSGRALLREVGQRVDELADGAVPKVFD